MNFLGHTATNTFMAGSTGVLFHQTGFMTSSEAAVYCAAFVFATLMLGPDLDLYHSKVSKNWGVFKVIWWPYAKLSKHRGLSHTPVISSVIRLGYVSLVIFLVGFLGYLLAAGLSFFEGLADLMSGGFEFGLQMAITILNQYKSEVFTKFLH